MQGGMTVANAEMEKPCHLVQAALCASPGPTERLHSLVPFSMTYSTLGSLTMSPQKLPLRLTSAVHQNCAMRTTVPSTEPYSAPHRKLHVPSTWNQNVNIVTHTPRKRF